MRAIDLADLVVIAGQVLATVIAIHPRIFIHIIGHQVQVTVSVDIGRSDDSGTIEDDAAT